MTEKNLSPKDILTQYRKKINVQDYSKKDVIQGVAFYEIKNFVSEDGSFSELGRLTKKGELEAIKGFRVAQVNYSKVMPGAIKAWHLHFSQEDVWYVPPTEHLLVGLLDLRKDSLTKNVSMRFVQGSGKSQLLYIPRGVAHGYVNVANRPMHMVYFVNQNFDPENSDEWRLPWDFLGSDFWKIRPG